MMWLRVVWEYVQEHKQGLAEAATAIVVGLAVGFCLGVLAGCGVVQSLEHQAKYEHQSSIPTYYDRGTIDHVGYCMLATLGKEESCGIFCPKMEGCVNWEVHGQSLLGENPGGELNVRFPFALQKFE